MGNREPCQVREEAALSGTSHVPQISLLSAARYLRAQLVYGHQPVSYTHLDVYKRQSPKFKELKEMVITTPQWISIDLDKLEGKIVTTPSREDIDLPIAEHNIVEFYSR